MNIETLQERITKAEAKIEKKGNTISKKQKSIEKKSKEFQKKWNITVESNQDMGINDFMKFGLSEDDARTACWEHIDIEELCDDIKRIKKEIKETEETLAKYKLQLAGEVEKESMFMAEVPESMKELETSLINEWNRWDIERRDFLKNKKYELSYKEFMNNYTYSDWTFTDKTDEQINNENKRLAKDEIIDLFRRVKDITGEVTDWSGIRLEQGNMFPVLTGTVTGKEGTARVETITAGGYNIQRLHIRTLVHEK